ncbi:MAG: alpha/beta hydrolase [Prevotellaceae bacterium]|nr:alpha/beta hydrolase [Prevotellaceae bacterium]
MRILFLTIAICMSTLLLAQPPIVIPLWQDGAPNSNGLTGTEGDMTVYPARKPNSITIIMCPGGGYARLAIDHEGHDMAPWMNSLGITYVVLKYRMPNGHREVPLSDAEQAIRLVRQHAAQWNVNPQKVGIMGASAGGHLAASLATLSESRDTRPDFQILFYPVISMESGSTHGGSRENLLGKEPSRDVVHNYSLQNRVTAQTPPAFIMLSADDDAVPPANSIDYFIALQRNKVPVSMHIYPTGGHGWGFRDTFIYKRQWTDELEKFLRLL